MAKQEKKQAPYFVRAAYPEEKVMAIDMYMTQKGLDMEQAMAGFLDVLFKQNVPQKVREYITAKEEFQPGAAPKGPPEGCHKEKTGGQEGDSAPPEDESGPEDGIFSPSAGLF